MPMVRFEGVSKFFGDLVAVSDVSFDVDAGVTALLGPNGAGKSTILRLICGQAVPSKGQLWVMGEDPRRDYAVSRQIGVAPQQESLFEVVTALEFVRLAASLHGLDRPVEVAASAIEQVDLDPDDRRALATYSKGMRQRVKLAQAIVHDPRLIVLDEPLSGLDPRQRLRMVELFHRLGDQGRCVIVSSHVLEEVERFGSRVIVVSRGRMAAEGDFREIRALMDDRPHEIRIRADDSRRLAVGLLERGLVGAVTLEDTAVVVETGDVRALSRAVAPLAIELEVELLELVPLNDDLESVFRYLVGGR
jgi:ABC-2 type transport system ATP-binding protein